MDLEKIRMHHPTVLDPTSWILNGGMEGSQFDKDRNPSQGIERIEFLCLAKGAGFRMRNSTHHSALNISFKYCMAGTDDSLRMIAFGIQIKNMEALPTAPMNGRGALTDEASRLKMQDALRGAADSMETPNDIMLRLINAHLEVAVVRTGCDLGIFKALVESDTPLSVEQLSGSSGADPLLIGRLLRYLAATRMITETSKDHFTASNSTQALANPAIHSAMYYIFNISGPAYQVLPDFLGENKYQTRTAGNAWQKANNTDLEFFPWAKQYPEKLTWFQSLMSVPRDGDWLDMVDFTEAAASVVPDRALFVDVGGSIGHQCMRLKARYPCVPGRIIVQDLEESVKAAQPIEGVEFMVHNFFNPQPIKGAKFYYLRTVLHDWPDDKAEQILKNLVPAMSLDSLLLIDDMVLPNTGVHWWSACLDLHMYAMLGAMERNVDQWYTLLDKAGLKVREIKTYMPMMRNSIIMATLK
ncbi:MAG: hypothetical protein LQ347_002190 [Umbilicaria vellea]|nr:MAG: hypothetical protein LQ347_002190 [Umbilicaria vellea]